MNCKQIDELLPLYAGRDLDEKRARLVGEHVEICSACARAANEYQETFHLTQQFTPPVFSDNAYASVRRRVLSEIENEPASPALAQVFVSWFRPRMTWAVASVVVIVVAAFAVYFLANRPTNPQQIADNRGKTSDNQSATSAVSTPQPPPSASSPTERYPQPQRRAPRSLNRSTVAAKLNDSLPRATKRSPSGRDSVTPDAVPNHDSTLPDRTLRVEIQTRNPNIRIIWFTGQETKSGTRNLKGI